MFLVDDGIIISTKRLGSSARILRCFLRNHGLKSAIIYSKHPLALGSFVVAEWRGRLVEQLGTYRIEYQALNPGPSISLMKKESLILNTTLNTIHFCLVDQEKNEEIWQELYNFIVMLGTDNDILSKLYYYLKIELKILKNSGMIGYGNSISIDDIEKLYSKKNEQSEQNSRYNCEIIVKFNKILNYVMDNMEKTLLYNFPGIMPARKIIKSMLCG